VTHQTVTPSGTYTTVEGDRLRSQALVIAPLVDEWTGAAPSQVGAESRSPWVRAHVTDGHVVLTGLQERAMPHLATAPQTVRVSIQPSGRSRFEVELVVPMGAVLPWRAPAIALESSAVAVVGKVRERDFPHAAVAGATVDIGGAGGRQLVALRAPLALGHDAGVTVGRRALAQVSAAVSAAASAGATRLLITPTTGIVPGTVLALGTVEREEHVTVLGVEPGGVVVLRVPLVRTLDEGAPVRRFSTGGLSSPTTLARTVRPGDGVVLTAAASTADVLEVSDGARTELRSTGLLSDTAGSWRLDGVRGLPSLTLTVSAAGLTAVGPAVHPLSGTSDPNVLDVDLPA
jgi:hypothetical protein